MIKEVSGLSNMSFYKNILKNKLILSTLFLVGALLIIKLLLGFWDYESTDNAYVDANVTTISSEVNGKIVKVYYTNNQEVKKGDVLAEIDDHDYKINDHKAQAILEQSQSNVKITEQKILLARLNIQEANKAIQLNDINLIIAEREFNRVNALMQDNFSSKKLADSANMAYEKAKFEKAQAVIALESAQEDFKLLELEKTMNLAKIDEAEQAKLLAENQLNDTIIKAPIDGIIADSFLILGNFAKVGAPLVSIVPAEMHIQANFKETQVTKISAGMKACITFDGIKKELDGIVRSNSPATGSKFSLIPTDNSVGNFTKVVQRVPVYIDFNVPQDLKGKILPGMSVYVKVKLKSN